MRNPIIPQEAGPEDPMCQGIDARGEMCKYKPVAGGVYCVYHGGRGQLAALSERQQSIYDFQKTQYLRQVEQKINAIERNPRSQSMRDEIGILRVMLQEILDSCTDEALLVLRAGEITNLTVSIEKLMKTSFTMDKEMKELMTKDDAKALAQKLLNVLIDNIQEYEKEQQRKYDHILNMLKDTPYYSDVSEFLITEEPKIIERVADQFTNVIKGN
jgi:hypothetical protein